jgi:hypothetical protein
MRRRKPQRKTGRNEQGDMVHMISDLAEFEEFRKQLIPMLRTDLLNGLTTAQMREKYLPMLTARKVQIGLLDPDSSKALAAIKDVVDRQEGRPIERKAVAHRFESMTDIELDALLASKLRKTGALESGDSNDE